MYIEYGTIMSLVFRISFNMQTASYLQSLTVLRGIHSVRPCSNMLRQFIMWRLQNVNRSDCTVPIKTLSRQRKCRQGPGEFTVNFIRSEINSGSTNGIEKERAGKRSFSRLAVALHEPTPARCIPPRNVIDNNFYSIKLWSFPIPPS